MLRDKFESTQESNNSKSFWAVQVDKLLDARTGYALLSKKEKLNNGFRATPVPMHENKLFSYRPQGPHWVCICIDYGTVNNTGAETLHTLPHVSLATHVLLTQIFKTLADLKVHKNKSYSQVLFLLTA